MEILKLTKEIHENAVAHGWWEKRSSFGEIIALIHSELSEALEEYRNGCSMIYYPCKSGELCVLEHSSNVVACMERTSDEESGRLCKHRSEKPEGIAVELADAIIRILDYFGQIEAKIITAEPKRLNLKETTFPELVAQCHCFVALAYIHEGCGREAKAVEDLLDCIYYIIYWCRQRDISIESIIKIKHEYNKTRPYRHGGKVC